MTAGGLSIDDRLAVEDLISDYALALDRDDVDAVLALFVPDGVFETYGREFAGHDRLRRMLESAPKGLHLAGRTRISSREGGATVRKQLMFVDAQTHETRLALYEDQVEKVDGQWMFRRITCQFIGPDGTLADKP
jgi:hypothetical protein